MNPSRTKDMHRKRIKMPLKALFCVRYGYKAQASPLHTCWPPQPVHSPHPACSCAWHHVLHCLTPGRCQARQLLQPGHTLLFQNTTSAFPARIIKQTQRAPQEILLNCFRSLEFKQDKMFHCLNLAFKKYLNAKPDPQTGNISLFTTCHWSIWHCKTNPAYGGLNRNSQNCSRKPRLTSASAVGPAGRCMLTPITFSPRASSDCSAAFSCPTLLTSPVRESQSQKGRNTDKAWQGTATGPSQGGEIRAHRALGWLHQSRHLYSRGSNLCLSLHPERFQNDLSPMGSGLRDRPDIWNCKDSPGSTLRTWSTLNCSLMLLAVNAPTVIFNPSKAKPRPPTTGYCVSALPSGIPATEYGSSLKMYSASLKPELLQGNQQIINCICFQ